MTTHDETGELRTALYVGHVMHRRTGSVAHRFVYRVFALCIDLDELPLLARRLRGFSYNRFNLLSFHDRDHGARNGEPLRLWAEQKLRDAGIDGHPLRIRLLCFPRMLGYVFNPLSVWFCEDEKGETFAIIYEVFNTFGDSHSYVLPVTAPATGDPISHACSKAFHVSPFLPVAGRYAFRLMPPGEKLSLAILYRSCSGDRLAAIQTGRRRNLTSRALLVAAATHPLMTLKVIAGIHWEALQLWRKSARFHRRPSSVLAPGRGSPNRAVGHDAARSPR